MSISKIKAGQRPPLTTRIFLPIYQLSRWITIIVRRQWYHLGLMALVLLGIVLSIGLITSSSFFSEAVDRVILLEELSQFSSQTGRPPFSTSVYIIPSSARPLTLQNAELISKDIAGTLTGEVGLPLKHLGLQVSSGGLMLSPGKDNAKYDSPQQYLGNAEMVYIKDIAQHIEVVAGKLLDEDGKSSAGVLEVWMHKKLAETMGVVPGETYGVGPTLFENPIPLRVAGIWQAKDPQSEFWFVNPDNALKNAFLVRRQDYLDFVQPIVAAGSRGVDWYVILDHSEMLPRNSGRYLAGFRRAQEIINQFLPGARLNTPPLDPLEKFVSRNRSLTTLLIAYNLPWFFILIYFLVLISTVVAQWQRRETAILYSRGMSTAELLNLIVLEHGILLLIGIPLGILFGIGLATVMGFSSSFLSFTRRDLLPVTIQGLNPALTILALSLGLLARLWPALRMARQSVVTEEREWARPSRIPFWYRFFLDLWLVLPTWYLYNQIEKRGSLANLVINGPEDLYNDPLLILVPALFIVTVALIAMRLFPLLMMLIDQLAKVSPSVTFHLALRQLGRQGHEYVVPLLMVMVSLAIGIYTLSMASSLDKWLIERIYYRTGADLNITPVPLNSEDVPLDGNWIPVQQDFLELKGVQAVTRVANLPAAILPAGEKINVRILGIDRLEFPQAAWFRSDFASEPLGGLMNRLAMAENAVLVSNNLLKRLGMRVGDSLAMNITLDSVTTASATVTITGTYNFFPTIYEEDIPVVIGSLEYLNSLYGSIVRHNIWIKLKPGVTGQSVIKQLPRMQLSDFDTTHLDATQMVTRDQAMTERVGIFGTLTIGFLATLLMAVIGLLLYSYASLRERLYKFAVLNAIGLSRQQIMGQVIIEYSFLGIFGALAGGAIGLFASRMFIPFFRFSSLQGTLLPPLIPIINEQQIELLTVVIVTVIVLAEVLTMTTTLYRGLVQAIKTR